MEKQVTINFRNASNLIFISVILQVISCFLLGSFHTSIYDWTNILIPMFFGIISAILIRRGYRWMKWVYTVITFYYIFDFIACLIYVGTAGGLLHYSASILEYIFKIAAIVFLFKPSKEIQIELSN